MLQYRLYGGHSLPPGLEGFMKAGANIGSVIGQFSFGFAADYFGRKAVCKSFDPLLSPTFFFDAKTR
jgi:MFS transporter, PHS family, inorganic phosphate transporter